MKLRDRLLGTSTHDGTIDDAIRTLGWNWIAQRITQGDSRLEQWLSAPVAAPAGPFAPPAIRWS